MATKVEKAKAALIEAQTRQLLSWMGPAASPTQRYIAGVAIVKGAGGILRTLGVETGLKIDMSGMAGMPIEWPNAFAASVSLWDRIPKGVPSAAKALELVKSGFEAAPLGGGELGKKLNPAAGEEGVALVPTIIELDDLMVLALTIALIAETAGPAMGAFAGALAEGGIEVAEAAAGAVPFGGG